MLWKAFGDQTIAQKKTCISGTTSSKRAKNELKTNRALAGHQRPLTRVTSKKIKDLVLENRRLTIRDLADSVGISFDSVQTILKNVLCLKHVKSRLVPKSLNSFFF
ncbi:unnamed protein product [Euphydryas editha]|uniref:Transposase Tc1-like domain-containing protein n=1 Tax=Euphydryas editha TaxID=104508 RepID=A0AAU9TWM5_EUPED|nr:unnamed protein product [Euphydryas editha]